VLPIVTDEIRVTDEIPGAAIKSQLLAMRLVSFGSCQRGRAATEKALKTLGRHPFN